MPYETTICNFGTDGYRSNFNIVSFDFINYPIVTILIKFIFVEHYSFESV